MREVQEKLYDDLLLKQNNEKVEATETVEFSVDGQAFSIDLTEANAELFREQFRPFAEAATPVTKRSSGKKKGTSASGGTQPTSSPKKPGSAKDVDEENQRIRTWARENGFELSERGRIPQHVKDAYWEAQHNASSGQVVHDRLTDDTPPEEPTLDFTEDAAADSEPDGADEVERV